MSELLEQDRAGSIRKALPATGLRYRTWLTRLRRLKETLGIPVLTTRRGGASHGSAALTPAARQLVGVYRQWREDVERASQRAFERAMRRVAGATR
jgi:molybdate transport repressor ModE-like protein